MLYETLSQPKLLVLFIISGFISGFIFDIGNYIKFLLSNNKILNVLLDIIEMTVILIIWFNINLHFNYGSIRFYSVFIFTITFWLERITIGKIVAKFYLKCYSLLIRLKNKIWRKNDKAN